jgi:hypothetical protein
MHKSIVLALTLTLSLVAVGCVSDEPDPTPAEVELAPATLETSPTKEAPPGEIDPLARDFCCVVRWIRR